MKDRLTPERAEILALQALAWLAGRPEDIDRFLANSGLGAGELRHAAGQPHLLGAVLEFLLANEPLLLDFCQDNSTQVKAVHVARHQLEAACG
jgi:hypothetical protein